MTFVHTDCQVFNADIHNLLSMSDMWRSRAPPVPLDFLAIQNGTFMLRGEKITSPPEPPKAPLSRSVNTNGSKTRKSKNVKGTPSGNGHQPEHFSGVSRLKDQRKLTLQDNLLLFISRCVELISFTH